MTAKELLERYAAGERDFRDADLRNADLRNAAFHNSELRWADFSGAKVRDVRWPAPPMVLMAWWGTVSDDLTTELMRYDAANHPDPAAFDRWADDGECPYKLCQVQRSANFAENRALWPGWDPQRKVLSAYQLMQRVIEEKCDNA